jgi:integrase
MARRKKQLKSLSDAMKAPGPRAGSGVKYIQYSFTGIPNLYLLVYDTGARVFQFKMMCKKISYPVTIGPLGEITMVEAIEKTQLFRKMVKDGVDPRVCNEYGGNSPLEKIIREQYVPYIKENFKSYRNMLNMIEKRIIPTFGSVPLNRISKKMVRDFLQSIKEEINEKTGLKLSGATINRYHAFLSGFFNYMMEMDVIETNPCIGIRRAKENTSRARYLKDDEYPRLNEVMKPRMHEKSVRALYLLLVSGLRRGEILGLDWNDINFKSGEVYIREPKNGESRYVGFNSLAFDLLKVMYQERKNKPPEGKGKKGKKKPDWVFPSKSKTGHLQEISGTFKSLCKAAGIEGLVTHDCRRSHAVQLLRAGVGIATIQQVLGHKSLASSMVYARVTNTAVAEANEIAATKFKEAISG